MEKIFESVKKKLGFGCMRLPMKDGEVDYEQVSQMFDLFLERGFNYFDTAHGYLDGKSEVALRKCLVDRHPRDAYLLADKLSQNFFEKEEDIRPFFESQLEILGVSYFDFYLMHSQNYGNYDKYRRCRAYEIGEELKREGKIKHLGISFHDSAAFLDKILTECPMIEFVQLQFNYLDYTDESVQSGKCYEVCRKHNKPVVVMEPVKGGLLVNLPEKASNVLKELGNGSNASYAIRFAASFDGVFMVLSGMGSLDMVRDNTGYMKDFRPLDEKEAEAVRKVCAYIKNLDIIPCTGCSYCTSGCPMNIPIPAFFACLNSKNTFHTWGSGMYYHNVSGSSGAKASDCIGCGACEGICPQHLEIRDLLVKVAEEFEKKK